MVRIDPLPITTTIALKLQPVTSNQIFTIVNNNASVFEAKTGLTGKFVINGFIPELRAFSEIQSLSTVPIPDFSIEDSDTDKLLKTQQLMWGEEAKRFELHLWSSASSNPTAADWIKEGALPLVNSAGYPYTLHNPLDILTTNLSRQFGDNTCFGVSIKDVGWGLPQVMDTINVMGCWVQDGRIIQPDWQPTPINVVGGVVQNVIQYQRESTFNTAVAKRVLCEINPNRISGQIRNNSTTATIYVSETDITPTSTSNNGAIAPLATYNFRPGFTGALWGAASAGGTSTTLIEIFNM